MARPKRVDNSTKKTYEPARTPEDRENQMIALAVDLAEKQLSEGTASSQVITHYLKLGTTREKLEKEKIQRENDLLKAKAEALESAKNVEKLYRSALDAMRIYSGSLRSEEENEDI